MKNVLIIFGHEDSKRSFNAAMKDLAVEILQTNSIEVKVSNLYDMNFGFFSPSDIKGELDRPDQFNWAHESAIANKKGTMCDEVKQEQDKVTWADTIIYQFPMHSLWFPAVVSSWNSRVLTANFSHTEENFFDKGLMKDKQVLFSISIAGLENMYTDKGMFGDINIILYTMMKSFHFWGFSFLKPQLSYGVYEGNDECIRKNIENWKSRLETLHEEKALTNVTLPDTYFTPLGVLSEESLNKFAADEYGPTVGQHLGKKIPNIV